MFCFVVMFVVKVVPSPPKPMNEDLVSDVGEGLNAEGRVCGQACGPVHELDSGSSFER